MSGREGLVDFSAGDSFIVVVDFRVFDELVPLDHRGEMFAGDKVIIDAVDSISLGPSTSKADLMGYRDATGEYRSTAYRETYEDGGVFLFDEIDNAHPSVLTILNNSIANNQGEFPDKRISRHDDTRFIAAANTIGRGATAEYVGRTPIDAATIDRFAFVPMDIDPELEEALVLGSQVRNSYVDISSGGVPNAREWLAVVRAHREAVSELGIRAIIGQRAVDRKSVV